MSPSEFYLMSIDFKLSIILAVIVIWVSASYYYGYYDDDDDDWGDSP